MDAVLATASHELASPLAALGGSLQLAERWALHAHDRATPDQQQPMEAVTRLLHLANQQAGRLNWLVADLRDSTGIQARKLQLCLSGRTSLGSSPAWSLSSASSIHIMCFMLSRPSARRPL